MRPHGRESKVLLQQPGRGFGCKRQQRQGFLFQRKIPRNLVFDSAQIDALRQIFYEDIDILGFLKFVNEPIARGHGRVYMEVILTSVLPALYGWAGPFNQVYIKKLATIILEGLINLICYYATFVDFESLTCQSYYKTGPPEVSKTLRAKMALACGSSDNAFFSGSSSVAGIQVFIVQTMQL